jgi:hypothetical protein
MRRRARPIHRDPDFHVAQDERSMVDELCWDDVAV